MQQLLPQLLELLVLEQLQLQPQLLQVRADIAPVLHFVREC